MSEETAICLLSPSLFGKAVSEFWKGVRKGVNTTTSGAMLPLQIRGWRLLITFIIDFLVQFLVSRSAPPVPGLLNVPLAHSKSDPLSLAPLTLGSSPPITLHAAANAVLAPGVRCHVRLSSVYRHSSRVPKRSVNFLGWRW